jgi:nesprin-1
LLQLAEIENHEAGLVKAKYQPELERSLQNLDSEVTKVIDSRLGVHSKINDYRTYLSNAQSWLDGLSNKLEPLEKGGGLTLPQKGEYVNDILKEFDGGASKLEDVKHSAGEIMPSISNVDCQMVEEQIKSIDRRFGEMKKRISRKQQILSTTIKSYEDFKNDLEAYKKDIAKKSQGDLDELGFEVVPIETHLQGMKSTLKEIEGKQAVLNTLDRRLTTLQPELEESEIVEAEAALADVTKLHTASVENVKKNIGIVTDSLQSRRRFLEKVDAAKSRLARMSGEIGDLKHIPLASVDTQKKMDALRTQENTLKDFHDGILSEIKREGSAFEKECNTDQRSQLQLLVDGTLNFNWIYDLTMHVSL